jgi:rod shape-determining protein MreD
MLQPTLLHRMDMFARRLVPFGMTLALMLIALMPTHISGLSRVTPMYALASVYFWSIYRPDLMGSGSAFGIGLLDDALTGAPLGCSALVLLACHQIVLHQQKFFNAKPFGVFWAAFALLAFGAGLIKWFCVGLFAPGGFTPAGDMIVSAFLTAAIYPLIAWVLARAQLKLLSAP